MNVSPTVAPKSEQRRPLTRMMIWNYKREIRSEFDSFQRGFANILFILGLESMVTVILYKKEIRLTSLLGIVVVRW